MTASASRRTVSFALSTRASGRGRGRSTRRRRSVRTLASSSRTSAGRASLSWNGRDSSGHARPGRRATASESPPRRRASRRRRSRGVVVDRTLGHLEVAPTPLLPERRRPVGLDRIGFRLARQADVRVRIVDGDRSVATVHAARDACSRAALVFVGTAATERGGPGRRLSRASSRRRPRSGRARSRFPLRIDTRAPVVRIVSARHRKDGRTAVRLWLSEAATVRLRYGSPELTAAFARSSARPATPASRFPMPRASALRRRTPLRTWAPA